MPHKTKHPLKPKRPRKPLGERELGKIEGIIASGLTKRDAAMSVGCDVRTITNTRSKNAEFDQLLREAELNPIITHLDNISQAGKKSWRASAWFLERVYPDRFEKRKPNHLSFDEAGAEIEDITRELMVYVPEESKPLVRRRIREMQEEWTNGVETWHADDDEDEDDQSSRQTPCAETDDDDEEPMADDQEQMMDEEDDPYAFDPEEVLRAERAAARAGDQCSRHTPCADTERNEEAANGGTARADRQQRSKHKAAGPTLHSADRGRRLGRHHAEHDDHARDDYTHDDRTYEDFLPLEPWPGFIDDDAPAPEKPEDFNPAPWPGYYSGSKPPADWTEEQARAAKRAARAAAKPYGKGMTNDSSSNS